MEVLTDKQIIIGDASSREQVLEVFSNKAKELEFTESDLVPIFLEREKEFSTAFGNGVAIPHAKSSKVLKTGVFVYKSVNAINWDGEEVKLAIAIITPEDSSNVHLQILSQLYRKLMHSDFRESLLNAETEMEVLKIINLN